MGLLDFFRLGRVAVSTAQAVQRQRRSAREMQVLPMDRFVVECLEAINGSHGQWRARGRPPHPNAVALADTLHASAELREFYLHCNGFEAEQGEPPCAVLPVEGVRTGAGTNPTPAALLRRFWAAHGNDSDEPERLAVIPPDDLGALATNNAEAYVDPALLDAALVLLCKPDANQCIVLLTQTLGPRLPAGAVIDIENGGATRYDGFRHWLATQASIFGSL
jgi:hypothetical protein